jgi:hypothetical protein
VLGTEGALTAADIRDRTFLPGGLWLMFASHSAGTHEAGRYEAILRTKEIAGRRHRAGATGETSFVAALPQALLAAPGGPLAIIGCVDQGLVLVFKGREGELKFSRFLEFLRVVCRGSRIGTAMAGLHRDIPALTNEALDLFEQEQDANSRMDPPMGASSGEKADSQRLEYVQLERHALRSMILLGDPAARLPLSSRALTSGLAGG